MANVTQVQQVVGAIGNSPPSTTTTLPAASTTGNTLIVGIVLYSSDGATNEIDMAATSPVTDGTNTFTAVPAAEAKRTGTNWYQHLYFYVATNITGLSTEAITTNFARSTFSFVTVWEITPSTVDQGTSATGTGTAISAPSLTPPANGALGAMIIADEGSTPLFTPATGWTTDRNSTLGGGTTYGGHFPQTTAAAITFTATGPSDGSEDWSLSGITLIPPGGTPPAIAPAATAVSAATATIFASSAPHLTPAAATTAHTTAAVTAAAKLSATATAASRATATVTGPTVPTMPVISLGLPISTNADPGNTVTLANDNAYDSIWRSFTVPTTGTPVWLMLDLRTLDHSTSGQLSSTWFVWKGYGNNYYNGTQTLGSVSGSVFQFLPQNYTVDAHPSAGSAPAQSDAGWVNLATITNNRYSGRIHGPNDLHTYNWMRISITASSGPPGNDDVALQVQLRDIRATANDSIFAYGDSLTDESWNTVQPGNTLWPVINGIPTGPSEHSIRYAAGRADPPVIFDGAIGGWVSSTGWDNRADFIDANPCHYVVLGFGGNNANNAGGVWADETDPEAQSYKTDMQNLISYVLAAGKIPLVPRLYWFDAAAYDPNNATILNQILDELAVANPDAIVGPDIYAFMQANPNLLRDHLHPTFDDTNPAGQLGGFTGYEYYIRAWALTLARAIYTLPPAPDNVFVTASDFHLGVTVRQLGSLTVTETWHPRPNGIIHTRQQGNPTITGRDIQPVGNTHTRAQGNPTLSGRVLPAGLAHTRQQGHPAVNTLTLAPLALDRG